MIEDQKLDLNVARKSWVAPAVIEGSLALETEAAGAAGTDGTLS